MPTIAGTKNTKGRDRTAPRPIYAAVVTSVESGISTLLPAISGGVLVFSSPDKARFTACEQFGSGNPNVIVRVARIGVMLPGVG